MKPQLVEPGTKYFLYETLKQCNQKKLVYFNTLFNILLLVGFIAGFSWFLYYKYNTKKNNDELKLEKKQQEENMLIELVKKINDEHYRLKGHLITELPTFDNVFERKIPNVSQHTVVDLPIMTTNVDPNNNPILDSNMYLENHNKKIKYL
jgi:hypothetical protein